MAAQSGPSAVSVSVTLRGQTHQLALGSLATGRDLFEALSSATEMNAGMLKIIHKGKAIPNTDAPLALSSGAELVALASTAKEVQAGEDVLAEQRRREQIVATRATATVRKTHHAVNTIDTLDTARFHQINPFPEGPSTPWLGKRREMLERLAKDAAILDIMKRQSFTVGELTELHPHRDPTLLGINRNAGQSIGLRLLTDRLDGLRSYNSVRRVLIHELTHNKFGPHDLNFKELDSKLTKEVLAFEESARRAGNRLGGEIGEVFDPETRREAAAMATGDGCTVEATDAGGMSMSGGQRLGSSAMSTAVSRDPGLGDEARERAARAAEQRQRQ